MTRTLLVRGLVAVGLLQGLWIAHAQPRPPGTFQTQLVKPDLYLIRGEGGNVALYVTGDGVVLVDDMFDRNHADILAEVQAVTDQPVRYVFNTHQHDDHAGGNDRMLPIAEVIAHKNARANMVAKRQPYFEDTPGTPIGLPRVTFTDDTSVFLGGKEIRAHYFGRGHTNGDVVVLFPELGVIHSGDLFLLPGGPRTREPGRPVSVPVFIDYAQGGSFLDWSDTLGGVLSLDFDTVIPGHGPVSTRDDVVQFRADLEVMRDRLADLVRGGTRRADLVDILERDYGWRATGCPEAPPTGGCLQYQQVDAFIAELGQTSGRADTVPALTPQDRLDIGQLVSRYAYAIDECTNDGYDYADLYTPDGTFTAVQDGTVFATYGGRDRLAEAARGGMPTCEGVPWAGIVHLLVNHVIEPAPDGATGTVYLVGINVDGVPGKVEAQGHYEDVYVKTAGGWRFKSRRHELAPGQEEVSSGSGGAAQTGAEEVATGDRSAPTRPLGSEGNTGISNAVLRSQSEVRVLRVVVDPGGVRALHAHDDVRFHLFIPISGVMTLDLDGQPSVEVAPWSPYYMERGTRHGFRNRGSAPVEIMEVFIP